jgi:hypothetical protein
MGEKSNELPARRQGDAACEPSRPTPAITARSSRARPGWEGCERQTAAGLREPDWSNEETFWEVPAVQLYRPKLEQTERLGDIDPMIVPSVTPVNRLFFQELEATGTTWGDEVLEASPATPRRPPP